MGAILQLTAGKGGSLTVGEAVWATTFVLDGEAWVSAAGPSNSSVRLANTLSSSPSLPEHTSAILGKGYTACAVGTESSCPSGSSKGPGIPFKAVLPLFSINSYALLICSSQVGVEIFNLARILDGL